MVDLSIQRFSCNHEVHWGENFLLQFTIALVTVYKIGIDSTNLCSFNESLSGDREVIGSLLGALWSKSNSLHDANKAMYDSLAQFCYSKSMLSKMKPLHVKGYRPEDREDIIEVSSIFNLSRQRIVPWYGVWPCCQILMRFKLKSDGLHGPDSLWDLAHVRNTVTTVYISTSCPQS